MISLGSGPLHIVGALHTGIIYAHLHCLGICGHVCVEFDNYDEDEEDGDCVCISVVCMVCCTIQICPVQMWLRVGKGLQSPLQAKQPRLGS